MYTNHKRCILLKWELCWFLCVFTNEIDRFDSFSGKKFICNKHTAHSDESQKYWCEILDFNWQLNRYFRINIPSAVHICGAEKKNVFYFVRYDCVKVININSALSCYEKKVCRKKNDNKQNIRFKFQVKPYLFSFQPEINQTKSHRITNEMTQNLNEYQAAIK